MAPTCSCAAPSPGMCRCPRRKASTPGTATSLPEPCAQWCFACCFSAFGACGERPEPVTPARRLDRASLHWIGYGVLLAITVALWALYALNLARWPDSPDFGWRTMYTSGPNVVSQVFGEGQAAGLDRKSPCRERGENQGGG